MLRLECAEYLYLLISIPVIFALFYFARLSQRLILKKYGDISLLAKLLPDISKYKPAVKFSLVAIALAILIVGIANPQIGTKLEEVKREGVDVMIALDVSNSMKAEDIKPNRLERAKQAILKLIDNLHNDRIGLVAFAGEAFLQLPITSDYSAARLLVGTVDTEIIETQGTAIGKAIDLAAKSFNQEDTKHKVLIVITDGENHEDDAVGAATEVAKTGVIVHAIGLGSIEGGPIPIFSGGVRTGFRTDASGNVIVTKLDPTMLEQIATAGNGKFIRSADTDPDLAQLIKDIAAMEKKEYESKIFTEFEDRFQYFIAAALFFLIAEIFVSDKKIKFLEKLNLFGDKKQ